LEKAPDFSRLTAETLDRLARVTREMQYAEGLNPAQWEALRYIAGANTASRTPGALAAFLCTTKGTVSQTLIALESKGCVKRVRADCDRRKVFLEVTPAGKALLAKDPINRIAEAAARLPAELGKVLAQGLEQFFTNLQTLQGTKSFGVCRQCGLFLPGGSCGDGKDDTASRCGLSGVPVDEDSGKKLCVDFRPEAGAPPS
jgi:DNA-binding MarR family transcriptional regulator